MTENCCTLNTRGFLTFIKAASKNRHVTNIKFKGHGNSMFPFIENGNDLNVKLMRTTHNIKIGDIVAVMDQNINIIFVHRIIGRKEKLYLLKGDNRTSVDGWFPRESILGVITEIKRNSGRIIYYQRWQNFLIALFSRTNFLKKILMPVSMNIKKNCEKLYKSAN